MPSASAEHRYGPVQPSRHRERDTDVSQLRPHTKKKSFLPTGCDCTEHCSPPAQELSQHVHTLCTHVYTVQRTGTLGHYKVQEPNMDLRFITVVYIYCVYYYTNISVYTHVYNVQYLGTQGHFRGMIEDLNS